MFGKTVRRSWIGWTPKRSMSRTTTCTFRFGLATIENSDAVVAGVRCVSARSRPVTAGPSFAPLTSTPTVLQVAVVATLPAVIWTVVRLVTVWPLAVARQTSVYLPGFCTFAGTTSRTSVAPVPTFSRHV